MAGVGEALKLEIAGLVWADQLCLWGFAGCGFYISGRIVRGGRTCALSFKIVFAGFLPRCVAWRRIQHLLDHLVIDVHIFAGPRAVWLAVEGTIGDVSHMDVMRRPSF